MDISLNHIYPISEDKFFASFNFKNFPKDEVSSMKTYAYDGKEWFFVGGGSSHYNIGEVGCDRRTASKPWKEQTNFYHKPNRTELAIDYIFNNREYPKEFIFSVDNEDVSKALTSTLRDYKIENILTNK